MQTASGAGASAGQAARGAAADSAFELPVVLPEYPTTAHDAYLCTAIQLPDQPLKLVGITPNSDQRIVHHMLLFGEVPTVLLPQPVAAPGLLHHRYVKHLREHVSFGSHQRS